MPEPGIVSELPGNEIVLEKMFNVGAALVAARKGGDKPLLDIWTGDFQMKDLKARYGSIKRIPHFISQLELLSFWWIWLILISLSWLIYYPVVDNFFLWDDFLWLYRGKTLWTDIAQMFKLEEPLYLDPLVYLSFGVDYKLFGLNYKFYHAIDITLHAINGILVFYFARLVSGDRLLALLSGIVFISSFAASDAIFWSSSRVDLIATLFSLVSMMLFIKYLREDKLPFYVISILSYILALAAKSTPVVMPAFLLALLYYEEKRSKGYSHVIPFAIISIVYLSLIYFASGEGQNFISKSNYPSLYNYASTAVSFFIPERILSRLNLLYIFPLICSLLFLFFNLSSTNNAKHHGLFMMIYFLIPVLIGGSLRGFKIMPYGADPYYLLNSPNRRIYLASAGMSIFISSIVVGVYNKLLTDNKKFIAPVIIVSFIVAFVGLGYYENRQRENSWGTAADKFKSIVYGLKNIRPTLPDHSIVGFGNFKSFSAIWWEPLLKVYYDLDSVTVLSPPDFYEYLAYPVMPSDVDRHFVFVAGRKGVYDFTDSIRELLDKRLKYEQAENPLERERLYEECRNLALYLNYRATRLY